jgi:GMP synthase-like glutamine amidotransferase
MSEFDEDMTRPRTASTATKRDLMIIIDNDSQYIKEFESHLKAQEPPVKFVKFHYAVEIPEILFDVATGIVMSGGPGNPIEGPLDPTMAYELIDKCAEMRIPVMGFCLSAEIIATHYGGTIGKLKNRQKGMQAMTIKEEYQTDPIFADVKMPLTLYESHSWFIATLPEELRIMASSSVCEVEVFRHATLPIYGFQGHPEMTRSDEDGVGLDGKAILDNFLELCGYIGLVHKTAGSAGGEDAAKDVATHQ